MGRMSQPASGSNTKILLGNQSILSEPALGADLDVKICFTSESLAQNLNTQESSTICSCGTTRSRPKAGRGTFDVSGDISFEYSPSEYGRLIYHALGGYISCEDVDGLAHGRVLTELNETSTENFMYFTRDWVVGFPEEGGDVKLVYRNDDGNLKVSSASYAYDQFRKPFRSYVVNDVNGVDAGSGDWIVMKRGPDDHMPISEGYLEFQSEGKIYTVVYGSFTDTGMAGTHTLLADEFAVQVQELHRGRIQKEGVSGNTVAPGTVDFLEGTPVFAPAAMIDTTSVAAPYLFTDFLTSATDYSKNVVESGVWVYGVWEEAVDYSGELFTHHFEINPELPQGLTINTLRDKVGFIFTGMKVNELTFTFESQGYVTGTSSFIGIKEDSVVSLAREAKRGDATIYLDEEPVAFRDGSPVKGGYLTIGQEQLIKYASITPAYTSASGLWEIGGIVTDTNDPFAIQMTHWIGENVECNVTATDEDAPCDEEPRYSGFEAGMFMDDEKIEVLSASVTINNDIGGDKYMLGSRYRAALREGQCAVTGSITVEFDDGRNYKKFIDGESFSLEFRIASEDPEYVFDELGVYAPIGSSIFLPNCVFNGGNPQTQDTGYINTEFPFDSYVDGTVTQNTDAMVVICTNYMADNS